MTSTIEINLGSTAFEAMQSPAGAQLVYEDDGQTKYLYVLGPDNTIQEAIMLRPSDCADTRTGPVLSVSWSASGNAAKASTAQNVVAIVDFEHEQIYSASGFPNPRNWRKVEQAVAEACFSAA